MRGEASCGAGTGARSVGCWLACWVMWMKHACGLARHRHTKPSTPRPIPGVRLGGGPTIRAAHAVVSNASAPDTLRLLPSEAVPDSWRASVAETPLNPSFMHLHLGFDATGEHADAICFSAVRVVRACGSPMANGADVPQSSCCSNGLARRAAGLDDLELHHIVVNDWERGVDAQQNVVLVSIASGEGPV